MDATAAGAWIGAANGLVLFAISCWRKGSVDYAHVALSGAGVFASFNILPPFYLFTFVTNEATRATLPPELHGFEKYIAFAAVCSLLITVVAIVTLYKKAWEPSAKSPGSP